MKVNQRLHGLGRLIDSHLKLLSGVNHGGSLELAKLLIEKAKEGGADAVKFQTYKAETLASKNSPSYWDLSKEKTTSQYKLFKKFDNFDEEDYFELYEYSMKLNIDFLSHH